MAKATRNTKTIIKKTNYLKNNTNYGRCDCADSVWIKGIPIKGLDPKLWRLDTLGKKIKRDKLNSTKSKYAWNIDHIIPKTREGSDDLCNLQPLNRCDNIRFSNKLTTDKPGYNRRTHYDALLFKHGIKPSKSLNPKINKGDIVYARQTPLVKTWAFVEILDIDKKKDIVRVNWIDYNYEEELLYDASLFSIENNRLRS
jgi:hypothetical protein